MLNRIPEGHLYTALKAIRNFRARMITGGIDPRAVRVALKFALLVDDHHSSRILTTEQDQVLMRLAQDYFRRAKKGFNGRRT